MSCTFWNMRRRAAAEKSKQEQPVEIHEEPVKPAEEPVKEPKKRVKKDGK